MPACQGNSPHQTPFAQHLPCSDAKATKHYLKIDPAHRITSSSPLHLLFSVHPGMQVAAKMEYHGEKPEDAEELTGEELCRWWSHTFIRPGSSLQVPLLLVIPAYTVLACIDYLRFVIMQRNFCLHACCVATGG